MSRWRLVGFLVVFTVLAAGLFGRFLVRERPYVVGTPMPPPFFTEEVVRLDAGEEVCADDVTIDERAELLEVIADPVRRGTPGSPLRVTLTAPGYRATVRLDRGYDDRVSLQGRITPPSRSAIGRVCVANAGRRDAKLVASVEPRTDGRPVARLDGEPVPDFALTFYEARPGTVLGALPRIVERVALYDAGFVGPWLVWPMLIAVAVGLPLLVARAFAER